MVGFRYSHRGPYLFVWVGYSQRNGVLHRDLAYEYARLKTPTEREAYFKKHGVRWYAFARLTYFDAVRMTIIDPMHNLLLGE